MALLGSIAATSISPVTVADPDLWWHLRTGNWILQHGALPAHEVFSRPAMGQPWIAYSWLFEILTAKLFHLWGLRGIMALAAVLVAAGVSMLTALLARYTYLIRAIGLALAAHIPMLVSAAPRPWLFTILFFTIELWLLLEACERRRPGRLVLVVPLITIWANVHIQFVYGLALIGLFALQQTVHPQSGGLDDTDSRTPLRAGWLWALLAVSSVASLMNPYGWRLYMVVYQYASEVAPFAFVQEFQPLQFNNAPSWAFLALICSAWFVLGSARKKSPWLLLLLAASCICGFRMVRDTWFPLIVASLALAHSIRPDASELRSFGWKSWLAAGLVGFAVAVAAPSQIPAASFQSAVENRFPARACDFIESRSLSGPLFNSFAWGGYVIWRLPDMPVSVDGRTNLYGDEKLNRYVRTMKGEDWATDPELTKAKTILLERNSPLASVLSSDSRFRLVYEDKIACVFQPAQLPGQDAPRP